MKYIHFIYLFLFFILNIQQIFAGEEEYLSSLKGGDINVSANLVVEDAWHVYMKNHTDWSTITPSTNVATPFPKNDRFINIEMDGLVSLRWEGSEEEVYSSDWSYRIEVEIQTWDAIGTPLPIRTQWLYIDHKIARQENFKDWDMFRIPNANRIAVKVITLEYTDNQGAVSTANNQTVIVKEDIYIEAKIKVNRVFTLDVQASVNIQQMSPNITDRTIQHNWAHIEGAEEYDFEWLVISKDLETGFTPNAILDWDRATRVSLSHNQYTIELPFDRSNVYFRVRAVGYGNVLQHRLTTEWTSAAVLEIDHGNNIPPLEKDKNWAYSASYAEQGKRVETLSFADGSGRGRQSVTKDNSNLRSIVSETVFDREGRQAVQIIPSVAPDNQNQIKFFQNYNQAEEVSPSGQILSKPVDWTHFDQDANYNTIIPLKLSTISGASQYFSPDNSDVTSSLAAFIPNAEKYPYTQTIFDNQGRVKSQTGIGKIHRFGSGHETEIYHASAFQEDLDELFGSEVGYAKHYSMQMTKDPNGQLSIAYSNLSGKTIATALIGDVPRDGANQELVDPLSSGVYNYPTSRVKTRDLAPYNELEVDENSAAWVIRKEFMVSSSGDYDFSYSPTIGSYAQCFSSLEGSCDFELKINIYDSEGKVINSQLTALSPGTFNFGVFNPIDDGDVISFTFPATSVDIGAYTIEKELRLVNVAQKADDFFQELLNYKQAYESYLEDYYEAIVFNAQEPDVSKHLPVPSPPTHDYSGCVDFVSSLLPVSAFLDPCGNEDVNQDPLNLGYCSAIGNTLENDLLPGGQYFDHPTWLDNNIDLTVNPSYTYQGVSYTSWAAVKNLSNDEVRGFMEENNLFQFHPEWCLYDYQCLSTPDAITGRTWYEELLWQDASWAALDEVQADNLGYLTSPQSFCISDPANPQSFYGNISFPMLNQTKGILDDYSLTPDLEDNIKWHMCQYLYSTAGTPTYYDIGELAQLQDPNTTDIQKWEAIRPMMIEAKRRGINEHLENKFQNNANCNSLLSDNDPNDDQLIDVNGFHIRIPNHNDVLTQVENQTGISTTNYTAGGSTNQTVFNNFITNGVQNNALCDFYEARLVYNCIGIEDGVNGNRIEFYLDFSQNSTLAGIYGNNLTLAILPEGFNICFPFDIDQLQQTINTAIAGFASPLKEDIELIVQPINNNNPANTGSIELILRLKGTTVSSSNGISQNTTYQDVALEARYTRNNGAIITGSILKPVSYVDCNNQGYVTCVCEEIKALETYFNDPSLNPSLPVGISVYTAIADKYNLDMNLTGGDALTEYNIRYILKGYCGDDLSNNWTDVVFNDFVVPTASLAESHLPIGQYPVGGANDYFNWIAIFKSDPNLPSTYQTKIQECLNVSGELPCAEEQISLALYEASEQLFAEILQKTEAYKSFLKTICIGSSAPEQFQIQYTDNALHYTLYYYDASGNLERTVPPTGVALLDNTQYAAAANARDVNDPSIAPNVVPNHRMETTYEYNTLNEAVSSTAPDRGEVNTYYDILGRPVFTQNAQQVLDGTANYMIYDALGRVIETGLVKDDPYLTFAVTLAPSNATTLQDNLDNGSFPNTYVDFANWTKSEVRKTYYNEGLAHIDTKFEEEIGLKRNRVALQTYSMDGVNTDYQIGYNYDVFGNAKEIWQYYPQLLGNQYKQLKYDYDLISGVVHRVDYQERQKDQLSFEYFYDANNRLIKAKSSINGFIWNTEAKYEYYLHGPLQRVELGEDKVQGCDYVYNIQGWIKGVNSNLLMNSSDPGRDGNSSSTLHSTNDLHNKVAQDAFGYAVHYHDQDYKAINTAVQNFSLQPSETGNLYNGNISSVTQAQTKPAIGADPQVALPSIWKRYRYDQLHRITLARTMETAVGTSWGIFPSGKNAPPTSLQTEYTYGPNGNILSLKRYVQTPGNTYPLILDDLAYHYPSSGGTGSDPTQFVNNKLNHVTDVANTPNRTYDLESQSNDNYIYDANGSLIEDNSEDIQSIEWTSEKKVRYVTKSSNSPDLKYIYDVQGNRISKVLIPNVTGQKEQHTVYVRDPQGNVLAIYEYEKAATQIATSIYNTPSITLKEQMIYGSDRLGIIKRNVQVGGPIRMLGNGQTPFTVITPKIAVNSYLGNIESAPGLSYLDFDQERDEGFNINNVVDLKSVGNISLEILQDKSYGTYDANNPTLKTLILGTNDPVIQRLERIRGNYRYELKNFRGDIREVITDVKYREDNNNDNLVDVYTSNVIQVTDSYSFGWDIKERTFTVDDHRFGFNGKENDKEWGNQLIQDYGFRLYNPAIGKFLSVDPLAPKYPFYSPYHFGGNGPIENIDLDGLEPFRAADGRLLYRVKKGQGPTQIARDLNQNYAYLSTSIKDPTHIEIYWEDIVETYWNLRTFFKQIDMNDRGDKFLEDYKHLNMNEGDVIDISFWDGFSLKEVNAVAKEVVDLQRQIESLAAEGQKLHLKILEVESYEDLHEEQITAPSGGGGGLSDIKSGRAGGDAGMMVPNGRAGRILALKKQKEDNSALRESLQRRMKELGKMGREYIESNWTDLPDREGTTGGLIKE